MPNKNAKLIERYEQLVRVMRGLSRHERTKHFNMLQWGQETDCGTTMCAAGFAGSDPWFRRRGFRFVRSLGNLTVRYRGKTSWSAVHEFFDGEPKHLPYHRVFGDPHTVDEVIHAAKERIKELRAAQ